MAKYIVGKEDEYDYNERCWNCVTAIIFFGKPHGWDDTDRKICVTCINKNVWTTFKLEDKPFDYKCPHFVKREMEKLRVVK